MKSVRIASTVKHIEEADQNVTLFRIQEILSEHRSALVMGILSVDIPNKVYHPTALKFTIYSARKFTTCWLLVSLLERFIHFNITDLFFSS
jgi:hypothetical protein